MIASHSSSASHTATSTSQQSEAAKLFKGGAKSSKAYDAKAGKESSASSKSAKSFDSKSVKSRRFLVDGSGVRPCHLLFAFARIPLNLH